MVTPLVGSHTLCSGKEKELDMAGKTERGKREDGSEGVKRKLFVAHAVSFSLSPKTERVTQLCRAPFPETLFYPLSRVFRRSGSVVAVLRCPRRLRSHVRRPRAAQRSGSPLRRSSGLEARAREKRKTTTVVGEWEKKEGVLLSFGLCRISQLLPRGLGAQSLFIDASRKASFVKGREDYDDRREREEKGESVLL